MTKQEIEDLTRVIEPIIQRIVSEEVAKQICSDDDQPSRVFSKEGLLSYEEASDTLLPKVVSVRSLRRYASKKTPIKKRLKVVRMGHKTVGIRRSDLDVWIARCAGEDI